MRTAKEILYTYYTQEMSEPYGGRVPFDVIYKSINQARKEAIIECAEKATVKENGEQRVDLPTGSNFNTAEVYAPRYVVAKESILNLLNFIK